MRIIIIGSGVIGSTLAGSLVVDGHAVVLIDRDARRQAALDGTIDCQQVLGDATRPDVLMEAGIRGADLLVAVTGSDEVNLVVCRLAEHFGVPRRLARLRRTDLSGNASGVTPGLFGIDAVFSPEGLAVDLAERLVACPGAVEAAEFADGRLSLRAFPILPGTAVDGLPLANVRSVLPADATIVAVRRGSEALIPSGDDRLGTGDVAYVLTLPERIRAVAVVFAPRARPPRKLILFGAGLIGVELARRCRGLADRIILLGPDPGRAQRAAEALDPLGIEVIEGSALDLELIHRLAADASDILVTLSDDDENNLMAALLFRKHAGGTAILMTQKNHYADMFEMLDFSIVIDPRALAAGSILRFLRGGTVAALARLHHDDIEVLEFRVGERSKLLGRPLSELKLPRGMRVAAVMRSDTIEIATGTTRINSGDLVLAVVETRVVSSVRHLLR